MTRSRQMNAKLAAKKLKRAEDNFKKKVIQAKTLNAEMKEALEKRSDDANSLYNLWRMAENELLIAEEKLEKARKEMMV
jgi:hypothetical protein